MSPVSVNELAELTALALNAAKTAGRLVHSAWRKHPVAERKGRIDLVTEWDRRSEACVTECLSKHAPFAVVGEEGSDTTGGDVNAPVWFVDPIDGTTNFVHGHPFYCVSIGLAQRGVPLLGAIFAPALDVTWTGYAGGAAMRNGERCAVSLVNALDDALVATGFPYDRSTNKDNNFAPFVRVKKQALGVRRCGAAALDLCLVADGTYDAYWERSVKPWDVAAGSAIVRAAGGCVTAYDGGDFAVTTPHVLASNGALHPTLLAELLRAPLEIE